MPGKTGTAAARERRQLEKLLRRNYILIAVLPLVLIAVLALAGMMTLKTQVSTLLAESVQSVNEEAEKGLRELGEQLIITKAQDVATELSVFLAANPDRTFEELQADPVFQQIAVQTVGKSGYTVVTETNSYLIRAHPSESVINVDMRSMQDSMPGMFKLVEEAIDGQEMSGYYNWIEPDGSVRQKFMASSPVTVPVEGVILNAAATIYVDDFSSPMTAIQEKASGIIQSYRDYMDKEWLLFVSIIGIVFVVMLLPTWWLARRTASQYVTPIQELVTAMHEFGQDRSEPLSLTNISSRNDEIGQLAQSVEDMSGRVVDLVRGLANQIDELDNARDALRSLINSSADAIVTLDMEGRVTYLNPAFTKLFGWTRDELQGEFLTYFPPEDQDSAGQTVTDALATGRPLESLETRRLTKSGNIVDVSVSISRFNDRHGDPIGLLAILRDTSETRRLQEEVHHHERLRSLGNLAGGIAHDFNNLLMVIGGNISLMKEEQSLDDEAMGHLETIEQQIDSASSLTNQLLGYAGKGRFEVKIDDVNKVVKRCADAVYRTRKEITFHYHLADEPLNVEADFFQLEQVFMNLFINAADAMPNGGEMTVTSSQTWGTDGKQVRIELRDTGVGMDEDTRKRVFEPFFTTKGMGRGTGLGLASALGIIESHGGAINVVSEPGHGTTFIVYLPHFSSNAAAEKASTESLTPGVGKILCIDDEQAVLRVATRMLELLGYEPIPMPDGLTAIEYYRHHYQEIDLVMLDMVMPGLSGIEVFNKLQEINPKVRVLLSTGYSVDTDVTSTMAQHCAEFIQKPYGLEVLSRKVNNVLSMKDKTSNARI